MGSKWMAKESLYVPGSHALVIEHKVRRATKSDGIPLSAFCGGCRGSRPIGIIEQSRVVERDSTRDAKHWKPQIVCWKCCYGISPPLNSQNEIVSWATENL